MDFRTVPIFGKASMMALLMTGVSLWATVAIAGVNEDLINAAGHDDLPEVKRLLAKGADINAKVSLIGITALIGASYKGQREVVEFLLAKGADVNAKTYYGNTALMMASSNGHSEVVKLLLAKGADVNDKDEEGRTALDLARSRGVKELLIKVGAK
jgi:ankyrin repeat protein